jgi:hypothetical protein
MSELRLARVERVHPGRREVDISYLDDGCRVPRVPVMAPSAAADAGVNDLPERGQTAVVANARGGPIVLGFLFPPSTGQMAFAERHRTVYRHPSDVYWTVDEAGNVELAHPSGAFVRLGEDPAHEDLSGQDANGAWAIGRNTARQPWLRVSLGAGPVASITLDPAGNLYIRADGVLRLEGDGVEIHGRTYVQQDVHGKGSRETWAGGTTWQTDSYVAGAAGGTTEHGIDVPHIPSGHPEGP